MAYGVVHQFPGGTQEQYEAVYAAIHDGEDSADAPELTHRAGPSDDGWVITATYASKASWEQFRDGTLMPKFGAGIDGGFTTPPQETAYEVYADH